MSRPVSNPRLSYTVFETVAGWIALLSSSSGLRQVILPQTSPEEAIRLMLSTSGQSATQISPEAPDCPLFASPVSQIRRYFRGERVRLTAKLDFAGATSFQKHIWTATRAIPYGETRTYGWLARQAGSPKASRAAGQALRANHTPLFIPCHRVLRTGGGIGGFSGGIEIKRYLLRLEGVSSLSRPTHGS
jgi:methylated-DNA-[protein]-cysteine S-methyltransferase